VQEQVTDMGQFGSRCMNGWIVKWVSCQSLHKPIDRLPHGDNSLKKKQIDFLAHFSPAPEEKLSHQHLNSKFGLFNGLQTSQTSCMRRGRGRANERLRRQTASSTWFTRTNTL